jgi:hypothetical protein
VLGEDDICSGGDKGLAKPPTTIKKLFFQLIS